VAAGRPATIGVRDGQVYGSRVLLFPHRARNLLAVQQVMLDAREHAAPVAAIDRLVNYAADLYINPVATQNPVINAPEQIEKPALFALRGVAVRLVTIAPCFGFVLRHYARQIILLLR
jgi:hypothetical protein